MEKPEYVHLGYGLTALRPRENPPTDKDGKPLRDNRYENVRLAVKILDLLCEEEGGKLVTVDAIDALERAKARILHRQTQICQGACLPSIFDEAAHIESARQR